MKTTTRLLLVFSSTGLMMLAACSSGEAGAAAEQEAASVTPVPVEIVNPYYAEISAVYATTAVLTSEADAAVTARVAGELVELLVEEGDRVEAGEALARLDGERLRLEMLAAAADLAKASKAYSRNTDLHQRGLISTSTYEGLEYDLAAVKATFALKKLNYEYATIRAPIAGVVSLREVKPGQTVAAGDSTFRITGTTELVAHLKLPQAELPKFKASQRAAVRVAAAPGMKFSASIVRLSPTIDPASGTFRATAIIDNQQGRLAPGMFANFTIAYEKHADALLIPARALLDEDDRAAVYLVSGGEVVRRIVETGIEADGRIEILGGLSTEDQVVVTGQTGLRDGSKVLASTRKKENLSG